MIKIYGNCHYFSYFIQFYYALFYFISFYLFIYLFIYFFFTFFILGQQGPLFKLHEDLSNGTKVMVLVEIHGSVRVTRSYKDLDASKTYWPIRGDTLKKKKKLQYSVYYFVLSIFKLVDTGSVHISWQFVPTCGNLVCEEASTLAGIESIKIQLPSIGSCLFATLCENGF